MIIKTGDIFNQELRIVSSRAWRVNLYSNLIEYWEGNDTKPLEAGNGCVISILENDEENPGITVSIIYKVDVTKVEVEDWDKYCERFERVQKVDFDSDCVRFRDESGKRHFIWMDSVDHIHFTQEV